MDEKDLLEKITELENKLDKIYKSTEQTRKYFLAFIIMTVASLVIPMIGLAFAIPKFISVYSNILNGM